MKLLSLLILALFVAGCGSKSNPNPAAATPITPTPTTPTLQSVGLSAALSSLTQAGNTAQVTATGTYSNGTTQNVTATCTDWFADNAFVLGINSSGLMTARNSGTSTVTTSCQGVQGRGLVTLNLVPAQLWTYSGSGDTVFDMPSYVRRVRIRGVWNGRDTSNFAVEINGRLIVNEILRQMPNRTFEGTYLVTPGVVEITISSNIAWTFTEVR